MVGITAQSNMSLLFIGTPDFAAPSLRRLASDGYRISAVVTQPDRPAGRGRAARPPAIKLVAQELGLSVLQPRSLRAPETVRELRDLRPEVIVAVAYGQILRQEVLDIPPRGVVNVHPSLLPRWRGASPVQAAILAGDEVTGVTIMLMDAGTDSGPILSQRPFPIDSAATAGSLTGELSGIGADLLSETLPTWLDGHLRPRLQNSSAATACPLLRKDDGAMDWSLPASEIWRRVRAYNPWPGAFTHFAEESINIWSAWPLDDVISAEPGTVVRITPDQQGRLPALAHDASFAVQTGRGLLAVLELQRAGRRRLRSADFLRGMPGVLGARLG